MLADEGCGRRRQVEPILGQLAAEIEAAKDRPRRPDRLQPPLNSRDGAEIHLRPGRRQPRHVQLAASLPGIVLGRRDPDVESRSREAQILDVKRDELGATERPGVAEEQRSIARGGQITRTCCTAWR